MISESHSDWKRWPARVRRLPPLVEVGELPVVDDCDVRERIGPVRVGVGDVHVRFGRHPRVTDRVGAPELPQPVPVRDRLGVTEVLDDLERAPEGEHLGVAHPLDRIGELLQVAVEPEDERHRARRLLDLLDPGPGGAHARLDLAPLPLHPPFEVGIVLGRLAQLHVHYVRPAPAPAVEREAGRVRPPMLHRLQHAGHVAPDLLLPSAVPVDDPRYPAHGRSPTDVMA